VGGGFFLTPVLRILGLEIVTAIGTCFFALIGNAAIGAWKHLKGGNGHFKLGVIMGLSGVGGVEFGKRFVLYPESQNLAGSSIRSIYIVILILISSFMLNEYRAEKKRMDAAQKEGKKQERKKICLPMRIVSKIGLPPKIRLPQSDLGSVSL